MLTIHIKLNHVTLFWEKGIVNMDIDVIFYMRKFKILNNQINGKLSIKIIDILLIKSKFIIKQINQQVV
jgi:hypothetical protein